MVLPIGHMYVLQGLFNQPMSENTLVPFLLLSGVGPGCVALIHVWGKPDFVSFFLLCRELSWLQAMQGHIRVYWRVHFWGRFRSLFDYSLDLMLSARWQ